MARKRCASTVSKKLAPRPLQKKRGREIRPKRHGLRKWLQGEKGGCLFWRRSKKKTVSVNGRNVPKKKNGNVRRKNNVRLMNGLDKKPKSADERNAKTAKRKKRNVDARTEHAKIVSGRKNASASRKRGKSMRRVEKPASSAFVRRMLNANAASRKSLIGIANGTATEIAIVIGIGIVTVVETGIETGVVGAEAEVGAGAGDGAGPDLVLVSGLEPSFLTIRRWTMPSHYNYCCTRVNK